MTFGEFIVRMTATALGAFSGGLIGIAVAKWELRKGRKFAAEAIERATKESAEYLREVSPQWVSTKDRLPEPYQPVFTHVVHTHSPNDGWWVIEDNMLLPDGSWEVDPDTDVHWVTHWKTKGERPEEFRNAENAGRG